jgi:MFS family permease
VPWPTLVLVTAGLFLAVLSTTVVSVALPTIGRELHASAAGLEWTVDAYVLVYASLLLAGGDRCGRAATALSVRVRSMGMLATRGRGNLPAAGGQFRAGRTR